MSGLLIFHNFGAYLPGMYKLLLRPLLFLLPPEAAHAFSLGILKFLLRIPGVKQLIKNKYSCHEPNLRTELFGLQFKNPVGMAAGFDKNGKYIRELALLGFGFVEIGTVTPRPQPGNPKPRLFRLLPDRALINRMGFNNDGAEKVAERLRKYGRTDIVIGGNIGKNKDTPEEKAADDYLACFRILFDVVDYFVLNVSSPNTEGLRNLQGRDRLRSLLKQVTEERNRRTPYKPVLVKIAPDLTEEGIKDVLDVAHEFGIDGIVAVNTTISRAKLTTSTEQLERIGSGGLSGAPLYRHALEVVRFITEQSGLKLPVIGVGGIMSLQEAAGALRAGASLIQLYTGFVYEGPGLIKKINTYLSKLKTKQ